MTIAEMRALLGLANDVPDADVVALYAAYLAGDAGGDAEPYVTLEAAKKHLNIEADVTDDDAFVSALIPAALRSIENATGRDLSTAGTTLASADRTVVGQAMLLLIGHWFANREAVRVGATNNSVNPMPLAVGFLIDPLRVWAI